MRKLCLLLSLCLPFLGQPAAFAQASPFNLNIFKTQSFTATGQTGAAIQLNGLTPGPSTVGSSYASGTITVGGTAITTVSFQVMGSSDNGATFYLLPVYTVANPAATPVTTVTATAAGLYQFNLAGLSHVKFVTTGTFTATSVTLILTASPNASISRNGSGGGTLSLTSPDGTIDVGGTGSAPTIDIDLTQANTWTQGMTIDDGLTTDQIAISSEGNGINFPSGSGMFEGLEGELVALIFNTGGGQTLVVEPSDGSNTASILALAGSPTGSHTSAFEADTGAATGYLVSTSAAGSLLDSGNTYETQLGIGADGGGDTPPVWAPSVGIGDVTTTITNTNIKLVGNVTVNGSPIGGGSSVTLENTYSAPGSFTFAHNLGSVFNQVNCVTRTGGSTYASATWSDFPVDDNDTTVTVPSAGDYICSFNSSGSIAPPSADFAVAISPTSQTLWPTMTGTQQPTFTVTQTGSGGYSGTATYSTSGLASGMTGAYSPATITGSGSNVLTLSFPASQAAASTTFTAQGSDGTNTHSVSPTITVGNINSGLVDCWPMTDGSGTTIADGCGTSNTQTLAAGAFTWGSHSGLPGSTPLFNGTAFTVGANQTATNFDGSTPFSVSSWINVSTVSVEQSILSTLDPSNNFVGWELQIDPSGRPHGFVVNSYPINAVEVFTTTCTVTASALHYVVMTYDGSKTAAGLAFYLDGTLCANAFPGENSLTGSIVNTKAVALGGRNGGTNPLNGVEAYTRIYNRILSPTDVTNYFSAGAR